MEWDCGVTSSESNIGDSSLEIGPRRNTWPSHLMLLLLAAFHLSLATALAAMGPRQRWMAWRKRKLS